MPDPVFDPPTPVVSVMLPPAPPEALVPVPAPPAPDVIAGLLPTPPVPEAFEVAPPATPFTLNRVVAVVPVAVLTDAGAVPASVNPVVDVDSQVRVISDRGFPRLDTG